MPMRSIFSDKGGHGATTVSATLETLTANTGRRTHTTDADTYQVAVHGAMGRRRPTISSSPKKQASHSTPQHRIGHKS